MCLNCTTQVLDCRDSGMTMRDGKCSTLVECANEQELRGQRLLLRLVYDPNNPLFARLDRTAPARAEVESMPPGPTIRHRSI